MNEPQFGDCVSPIKLVRLRSPKGDQSQKSWIVIAQNSAYCDIAQYAMNDDGQWNRGQFRFGCPYPLLWAALGELAYYGHTAWVILHGLSAALEKSKWLDALANGDIHLPTRKGKDGTRKRTGKISLSASCTEIDIMVAGKRIKLLDFANFGIDELQAEAPGFTCSIQGIAAKLCAMLSAARSIGLPIGKPTASQVGYAKLRQMSMTYPIVTCPDEDSRRLERRAYYGGRNEAYRLGDMDGPTWSYDVKSCYAMIARSMTLPMILLAKYPQGLPVEKMNDGTGTHKIADVVIETDTPDYPVRWHGSTIYPVGTFVTTLCYPELLHALDVGRVKKVLSVSYYSSCQWMQPYADWFFGAKEILQKKNLQSMAPFIKCVFNSSLGFTGRRKYEWQPMDLPGGPVWFVGRTTDPENPEHIVQAQILDSECRWLKIHGEPTEAFPAIHATICSWARIAILSVIEAAGRANVLYADTDGVLVNELGHINLCKSDIKIGNGPGELVLRDRQNECRIQGQKNYRLGDTVVCAGLPRASRSNWTVQTHLSTNTGCLRPNGRVVPLVMECEDIGGEKPRYVNRIAAINGH